MSAAYALGNLCALPLTKSSAKKSDKDESRRKSDAKSREHGFDMSTVSGALADALSPIGWGGRRAGRAAMLAKALRKGDVPFGVEHPATSTIASAMGGQLGGMALGGALGAGLGSLSPRFGAGMGGGIGLMVGGASGTLFGVVNAILERRRHMREIADEAAQRDKPIAASRDASLSRLAGILLPYGGAHRAGQADVHEKLVSKSPDQIKSPSSSNLLYAGHYLPYASHVIAPIGGAVQGYNASKRISSAK